MVRAPAVMMRKPTNDSRKWICRAPTISANPPSAANVPALSRRADKQRRPTDLAGESGIGLVEVLLDFGENPLLVLRERHG